MQKTLNVLVIDDVKANRLSAKEYLNNTDSILLNLQKEIHWNDAFAKKWSIPDDYFASNAQLIINDTYASTGLEAVEVLQNEKIDYILSDIFFHYDAQGTPEAIKSQIVEELSSYGVSNSDNLDDLYVERFNDENWAEKHNSWVQGTKAPPMGVYIARFLEKNQLSAAIILNTSVDHHNILGEPINQWSGSKEIYYNDADNAASVRVKGEAKSWAGTLPLVVGFGDYQIKKRFE